MLGGDSRNIGRRFDRHGAVAGQARRDIFRSFEHKAGRFGLGITALSKLTGNDPAHRIRNRDQRMIIDHGLQAAGHVAVRSLIDTGYAVTLRRSGLGARFTAQERKEKE